MLTHGHSDHIGFAERARTERGIPVSVHELDAALARGEVPNPAKGGGPIRPLPMLQFLLLGIRKGALRTKNLGAVGTFGDGATLDAPGAPRVVLVPGHTPGSAALVVEPRSVVFVGDAFATVAVTNGATGPMIAPFSADPAQALVSLDRLRGLDAGPGPARPRSAVDRWPRRGRGADPGGRTRCDGPPGRAPMTPLDSVPPVQSPCAMTSTIPSWRLAATSPTIA